MKDVAPIKRRLERIIAKERFGVKNLDKCPDDWKKKIQAAAELLAYKQAIIPYPYYNYDIGSFNGKRDGENIVSPSVIEKARSSLIRYCWGETDGNKIIDNPENQDLLASYSVMSMRRRLGHNVVIYSASSDRPTGKTLCASIIMQEAIFSRTKINHYCDTYWWLEYSNLVKLLSDDDNLASIIQSVDWVVIDNIDEKRITSDKSQVYLSSLFDSFFFQRLEDRLPTILIFRCDINSLPPNRFGLAIRRIFEDKNTTIINLTDNR